MSPDTLADTASPRRISGAGIARAAVLISVVTVAARLFGFARIVVFSRTVGTATCLGSAYYTANTVPNILYEIVAGGALASVVVPVVAGPLEREDRGAADVIASALLTWAVLLLLPVAALTALLAPPVLRLLVHPHPGPCDGSAVVAVGARMLVVFAPQVLLYGIGIVLSGVLQAHRRFLGPAVAPLLSSVVVIAAYVLFAAQGAGDIGQLPRVRELILSVGTTLGVVALTLPLTIPLRRAGVALRPTLRFPAGTASRVRRLAVAGAVALLAQQASVAVVLRLADSHDPRGGIVLYNLAWTLFLVPWAVLAVPIATSAFPALSGRVAVGDESGFAALAAVTTRAVVLVTAAAAAALVAAAEPLARALVLGTRGTPDPAVLARAIAAFAPGLVGYGLLAHLGRALYARGQGRAAAIGTVAGWLAVIAADVPLVLAVPRNWTIAALGAGNSIGMAVVGCWLLIALRRSSTGSLAGLPRAAVAAVLGGCLAALAGATVSGRLPAAGAAANLGAATAVSAVVAVVFAAVAVGLDASDMRALLARRHRG